MKHFTSRTILIASCALLLGFILLVPKPAAAVAPLGFHWECGGDTCAFTKTTSNHASYKYNFGDGTFSACTTTGNSNHDYGLSGWGTWHFNVSLIGYATPGCNSSPDNIQVCEIEVIINSIGGDPGTNGNCGP